MGTDLRGVADERGVAAASTPWSPRFPLCRTAASVQTSSMTLTGIGLLRIDHVGVAVPDLAESIEFYERVFGMR